MYGILDEFKALILTADPSATHYFGRGEGAYTVWTEYELEGLHGGNVYTEYKWHVLIERYTTEQDDQIAMSIMTALGSADNVVFQYSLRRNTDQELIYHAWDCEVT